MATMTAQILVGSGHPFHGGINPSHFLFLSENSRPAWILVRENIFGDDKEPEKVTWIPTLEHMFEDALLMIGLYVVQNEDLVALAREYFADPNADYVELYEDISQEHLQTLRDKNGALKEQYKIVLTVTKGSSILGQLHLLEKYAVEAEVCLSK